LGCEKLSIDGGRKVVTCAHRWADARKNGRKDDLVEMDCDGSSLSKISYCTVNVKGAVCAMLPDIAVTTSV